MVSDYTIKNFLDRGGYEYRDYQSPTFAKPGFAISLHVESPRPRDQYLYVRRVCPESQRINAIFMGNDHLLTRDEFVFIVEKLGVVKR